MTPEELARLLQQNAGPVFNPSFLQVDRNTGEVTSTDPAVAEGIRRERARQAPPTPPGAPVAMDPLGQGTAALPIPREPAVPSEPATYQYNPDPAGERSVGGEVYSFLTDSPESGSYYSRVGGRDPSGPEVQRAMEQEADRTTVERARMNPPPATSTPVLTEDALTTIPTTNDQSTQVTSRVVNGHPVYSFMGRDGQMYEVSSADQIAMARRLGLSPDVARDIAPTLPQPGSGGTGVPGGRLETQLETTVQAPVSDATLQRAQAANAGVVRAQKEVDAGNVLASQGAVGARDQVADLLTQQAQQAAQEQQARTNAIQMRAARLDRAISDVASQRVDPEGYFGAGGEGFGRRLGAVIAVALGSLGSSLTGGPNQALGIINAAIERNLAAQRSNMEHGRAMVGAQSQALSQMRDIYQDQGAAEQATRALQLQAVINRLDANLASMGPDQLAAAQELRNRLLEQQAAARQMAAERGAATMRVRATTTERVAPGTAQATAARFVQPRQPPAQAAPTPAPSQADRALDELVPSARGGRIRQEADRATARERQRRSSRTPPATSTTPLTPAEVNAEYNRADQLLQSGNATGAVNVLTAMRSRLPDPAMEANLDRELAVARERQRRQTPVPVPGTGEETSLVNQARGLEMQAAGERGQGGIRSFAYMRPLGTPEGNQRALASLADRQTAREVGELDRRIGAFTRAASTYIRLRREIGTTYIGDQTARGQMQQALYTLGTASREMGNMGTAGSVGELNIISELIPRDNEGITALAGPQLDRVLHRIDGVMTGAHDNLATIAESYGFEPSTVRQSARTAPDYRPGPTPMGERPR